MRRLGQLFKIAYPKALVFGHQTASSNGIPFVTSRGTNNGVAGRVERIQNAKIFPKGSITVPLKGTVLWAHLQPEAFYCAHQIAVLVPAEKMSSAQLLFYVLAIRSNTFRYNYGRQADRTLAAIQVPSSEEIPPWVDEVDLHPFDGAEKPEIQTETQNLDTSCWKWFELQSLFKLTKGKRLTKGEMQKGGTPFIGAIDSNNGCREWIANPAIHRGGTLTVHYNGSVAEAFYQPKPFWASDDVNVLYPRFNMTPAISLFIATVIRKEKYRFHYGRKWHLERMKVSKIKLPVDQEGNPDWKFMGYYITSLPFSSQI